MELCSTCRILLPTSLQKMSLLRQWAKKAKRNEAAKNNSTPSHTSKEYTKEPEGKKCNSFQNKSSRKFLSTSFIYNFSFRVSICLQLRFFKFFCILLTVSIHFYFSVAFPNYGGNLKYTKHIRNMPQFKDTE